MNDLHFWNDSIKSWTDMVENSCIFIRSDIAVGHYDEALEQIEVMRQKIVHMSEAIKSAREVYNDCAEKDS